MESTTNLWQALAQAADYPSPRLRLGLGVLVEACSPALPEAAQEFQKFRGEMDRLGLARFEELYTAAFDFEADSSLYVGYHIFGEDPRRSHFMAHLKGRYLELGLGAGVELPDHLAAIFRLLAAEPAGEEAEELVMDCLVPAVGKIRAALEGKGTPYAGLLRGVSLVLEEQAKSAFARRDVSCRPFSLSFSPTSR